MSWKVKREVVSIIPFDKKFPKGDMAELSKIVATHVETGNIYKLKQLIRVAAVGKPIDMKAAWDKIYKQHKERIEPSVTNPVETAGVDYLNAKEAADVS